ncbi:MULTISPECIES: PAS domain-containing sensor histidine kinase [unclassified Legionella]|uniref:PAS domain-containing sensor histidine kinase n=1 Tax=unclassified Legionella TaxID=2622702 RepID=UPI001E3FFB60|nr:PAS domain-containing sensor histidine kinase [Legionella sp. 31fI33]MCC5015836.1 response regulator [Legionella sp. 31fI33]
MVTQASSPTNQTMKEKINSLFFLSFLKEAERIVFFIDKKHTIKHIILKTDKNYFLELAYYQNKPFADAISHLNLDKKNIVNLMNKVNSTLFEQSELSDKNLNFEYTLLIAYINSSYLAIFTVIDRTNEALKSYINAIINTLPGAIYWKDKEGRYMGCNQFVANMAGFDKPEQVLGKTDFDLCWKEFAQDWRNLDLEVMRENKTYKREEPAKLANGRVITELTIKSPLYNEKNEIVGIIGTSMDITEQKNLEQDLIIARQKAEAASRAKTEFIANMSHDIRTPLIGVIGISEILENTLDDPEQKKDARMLYDSGEELLRMLNDILRDVSVGNMDANDIHLDTFDLYQCIADLVKLERPTTTLKNLGLNVDIDRNVPRYIVSDRNKIHRILLNLLGNAIKFTLAGQITIQISCLESNDSDIRLKFSVSDTGIGISKNIQDKVFDRFFRATPSYKGIYKGYGLGLHIVRSYVELLGGEIGLSSTEGVGTTVYFELSCRKGVEGDVIIEKLAESQFHSPTPLTSSSLTKLSHPTNENEKTPLLLLVEDNMLAAKILETMVSKNGYRFKSASTGEEALELAKANHFDLIITDVGLPGMSGNELVAKIREWEIAHTKKPIPIIGLTGHTTGVMQAECLKAGMDDVFTKPITLHMIQNIVNKYIIKHSEETQNTKTISSQGLGEELPATERELFELGRMPIFCEKEALKHFDGNLTLLQELIREFISEGRQDDIYQIEKAYTTKNWSEIEKIAHKLKGGAVYLGTARLELACQYLERYYKAGHRTLLEQLYHQLLKVNQETIDALRQWLRQGKP